MFIIIFVSFALIYFILFLIFFIRLRSLFIKKITLQLYKGIVFVEVLFFRLLNFGLIII